MAFTRADNEAAIDLYRRELAQSRPSAAAEAGLAAALVQRVIRWPETIGSTRQGADTMGMALSRGLTTTPEARDVLYRADQLAERAVRRTPGDTDAWRVLGLVRTARRDMAGAFDAYERALQIDPQDWKVQINLGELYDIRGDAARADRAFTAAYDAMGKAYETEPQRVGPWRAPLGVLIAERDRKAMRLEEAEAWYRRVLSDEPFDADATKGLASLLKASGRSAEGQMLCKAYQQRTGSQIHC